MFQSAIIYQKSYASEFIYTEDFSEKKIAILEVNNMKTPSVALYVAL